MTTQPNIPVKNTAAVKRVRWSLNPLARKRWERFRRHGRGYWSMIIIAGLYMMSLGSELICNDRPLFVRHEGKSYFPIFKFYPDDVFTGSGLQTRPDYKTLDQSSDFAEADANYMVFPFFKYGPFEIIKAESLRDKETVQLTLHSKPRVASINVDQELSITRALSADVFLGDVQPEHLNEIWDIPLAITQGIAHRFANEKAPEVKLIVTNKLNAEITAEIRMRAYKPRRSAPRDVRLTFREVDDSDVSRYVLSFNRSMELSTSGASIWKELSDDQHQMLLDQVRDGFAGTVKSTTIEHNGIRYTSQVRFDEIRWPFRPVTGHWMGIDSAGRDVLARILYGLRIAMTFGLLLVTASMGLGILMGAVQGFYGGKMDLLGQRFIEIWSTIPFLYVMILLGSMYGRSFSLLLFCYGLFNWIGISYYVRAEFLRLRTTPFVDAARCLGIKPGRIMFRHILPNALTPIITFLPFSLVGAIGSLAILDFLGFGLPPPTPSWGELLQQAQAFRWAWWLILYPSAALFAVILLVVFIGEGIRDAYDPKPVMRME